MHKVQVPSKSECYTTSSEPIIFYFIRVLLYFTSYLVQYDLLDCYIVGLRYCKGRSAAFP
jgi:hypothetical protein